MKFEIRQSFSLHCARYLPKLPKEHPCSRIHGHLFQVTLVLRGELSSDGWVKDFNEIKDIFWGLSVILGIIDF